MTKLRKATATLTPLAPSPAPAVAGLPHWVLITGALVAALASAGAAVAQTDVSGSNTVSVDQVQHNLSIDQDRIGDAQRAQLAFSSALTTTGRRFWGFDYGSAARDALATAMLTAFSTQKAGTQQGQRREADPGEPGLQHPAPAQRQRWRAGTTR